MLRQVMSRWPATLIRWLIRWVAIRCSLHLKSMSQVPVSDQVDLRYEELCQSPRATMQRALGELGMTGNDIDYASMIGPRSTSVHEIVAIHQRFIEKKLAKYLRTVGLTTAS